MNRWLKKHFTSNQLFFLYILLVAVGALISIGAVSLVENPIAYIAGFVIIGIAFIVLDAA